MDLLDPPGPSTVVRFALGAALAVAVVLLVVVSVASGHIVWDLAAFALLLWAAWSFFGSVFESLQSLGGLLGGALTGGGETPPGTAITIDQETGMLERLVGADPAPPPHRVIIAGIRLAEIYRTHQHDAAKAEALIAQLTARYPDAPELEYVRAR